MSSKIFLFSFVFLQSLTSWSQSTVGAVSESTGSSGRAAVEPGVSTFVNPATLVHIRGRSLYTGYAPGDLAIAMTENVKGRPLAAAMGYARHELTERNKVEDARLSFAEFLAKGWAFGITPHYFQTQLGVERKSQFDLDLGVTYTPTANLGIALIGYDLLDDNKNIPSEFRPASHSAIGMNYVYRSFARFRFDIQSQKNQGWSDPSMGGGIETYTNRWIVFRLGYLSDRDLKKELSSAGLGLDLPLFKVNYAFVAEAQGLKDPRHFVDLTIPF